MALSEAELAKLTADNFEMQHRVKADAFKSLDNILFVVSTGAVAISITFIGSFKDDVSLLQAVLLIIAWVCLLGAILSSAMTHWYIGEIALNDQMFLNNFRLSGFKKPTNDWEPQKGSAEDIPWNMDSSKLEPISTYLKKWKMWKTLAYGLVIVGTLFLVIFGGSILVDQIGPQSNHFVFWHHRGEQ